MRKLLIVAVALLISLPAGLFAADDVATLVKQLKDKDPSMRAKAARALESIDPSAAKDAVPVLIEALKEKQDMTIAPVAAKALGRLGSAAVPALIEVLEIKDGRLQAYAALALKQIGPDAKAAVPAL